MNPKLYPYQELFLEQLRLLEPGSHIAFHTRYRTKSAFTKAMEKSQAEYYKEFVGKTADFFILDEASSLPDAVVHDSVRYVQDFKTTEPKDHERINQMGIHTIAVNFEHDLTGRGTAYTRKKYYYLTNDESIQEGDYVVVMSPTTGPTTVKVVEVFHNTKHSLAYKRIIDKVDMTAYQEAERKKAYNAQRKRIVDSTIAMINDKLAHREEALRKEMIRQRLLQDEEYQRLVGDLQGFAQEQRELEEEGY